MKQFNWFCTRLMVGSLVLFCLALAALAGPGVVEAVTRWLYSVFYAETIAQGLWNFGSALAMPSLVVFYLTAIVWRMVVDL